VEDPTAEMDSGVKKRVRLTKLNILSHKIGPKIPHGMWLSGNLSLSDVAPHARRMETPMAL